MSEKVVAVVGATGAVGQEMIRTLERRNFPVKELRAFASPRSRGKTVKFKGRDIKVEVLEEAELKKGEIDIALFSAGGSTSKQFAPKFAEVGTVVIDNSSAWRMEKDVPLVVPEVNPDDVEWHKGIIANPNCSTIQMVVVLKPLHDYAKIKRVVVSTYQAVSGAGGKAIAELEEQTKLWCQGKIDEAQYNKFPYQIAFNVIPHIDVFFPDGYTKEELKMVNETKKIMHDDSIKVTATCVRVPVFRGHSEAVNLEFEKPITPEKARELLEQADGVVVVDNPEKNEYPLPIFAEDKFETFVGRIRKDDTVENGLNLWVVSDNLLKGAALNAVQIAELLLEKNLV